MGTARPRLAAGAVAEAAAVGLPDGEDEASPLDAPGLGEPAVGADADGVPPALQAARNHVMIRAVPSRRIVHPSTPGRSDETRTLQTV
jgi:hypothetical protein